MSVRGELLPVSRINSVLVGTGASDGATCNPATDTTLISTIRLLSRYCTTLWAQRCNVDVITLVGYRYVVCSRESLSRAEM